MKFKGRQVSKVFGATVVGLSIVAAVLLVPVFGENYVKKSYAYTDDPCFNYSYRTIKMPNGRTGIRYGRLPVSCVTIKMPNGRTGIRYGNFPVLR